MLRALLSLMLVVSAAGSALAQAPAGPGCCGNGPAPIAGAPLIEFKGKVTQVRLNPGQGMPSLTVKTGIEEPVVLLGSMRYLMAQNFNPKVGDEIVVKAYRTATCLVAASVTLPETNKTIRLRDDSGRPVWRGGPRW